MNLSIKSSLPLWKYCISKMDTRKKWLVDPSVALPRRTKYRRKTEDGSKLSTKRLDIYLEATNENVIKNVNSLEVNEEEDCMEISYEDSTDHPNQSNPLDFGQFHTEVFHQDHLADSDEESFTCILDNESEHTENGESSGININKDILDNEKPDNCSFNTVLDFTTLVQAFCHRYTLSDVATDSLLQLFHLSFGLSVNEQKKLPESAYLLKKKSNLLTKLGAQLGWQCSDCGTEIYCDFQDRKTPNDYIFCDNCNLTAQQKSNYFVTINTKKTLELLLENDKTVQNAATKNKCEHSGNKLYDVCCGSVLKTFRGECIEEDVGLLTVMVNTDGAPVFAGSKCSVWPILLTINEIPPKKRKNYVLCVGLWFGNEKPHFESFLQNFIKDMKILNESPIHWYKGNDEIQTKVICIGGLADSVARPVLQNMHQFNGSYGCQCCENPGTSIAKGGGHVLVYDPILEYTKRNINTHKEYIKKATSTTPEKGVKGPSYLSNLPNFDIIDHMPIDYMHAVLLGTVRAFTGLWFSTSKSCAQFGLKEKIDCVNFYLLNILPHNLISRTPRSLEDIAYWKAHEWRNWLLYYSPILLKQYWPEDVSENWCLLSSSIHMLSRDGIDRGDLETCKDNIKSFVKGVRAIYGVECCSYNVHMLTHLCDCVEKYGPLFGFSLFTYENFNQILLKSITGTQAVPSQMVTHYLKDLFLRQVYYDEENAFKKMFECLTKSNKNIKQLFKKTTLQELGLHSDDLKNIIGGASITEVITFSRLKLKSFIIQSESYTRCTKRNSSWVFLKSGSVMNIHKFVLITTSNKCINFALGDVYETTNPKLSKFVNFKHHILQICTSKAYGLVSEIQIEEPVMYISINRAEYCLKLANLIEIND